MALCALIGFVRSEGPFAVVAFAAVFARNDFYHFHFCIAFNHHEWLRMTVAASKPLFRMGPAIEGYYADACLPLKNAPEGDCQGR